MSQAYYCHNKSAAVYLLTSGLPRFRRQVDIHLRARFCHCVRNEGSRRMAPKKCMCRCSMAMYCAVLVTCGVLRSIVIRNPAPVAQSDHAQRFRKCFSFGSVVRPWPFLKERGRVRGIPSVLRPLENTEKFVVRGEDGGRCSGFGESESWLMPARSLTRKPVAAETSWRDVGRKFNFEPPDSFCDQVWS
jgi:hypothetical protein